MSARRRHSAGYTLIELTLTLAILGLLAGLALPHLPRPDTAEADRSTALQTLRMARRAAIASTCPLLVTLDQAGLAVQHAPDPGTQCPAAGTPVAGLAREWPRAPGARLRPTAQLRFEADGRSEGAHRLDFGSGRALRIDADTGHAEHE